MLAFCLFLLPIFCFADNSLFISDQPTLQHYQVVRTDGEKSTGAQLVNANAQRPEAESPGIASGSAVTDTKQSQLAPSNQIQTAQSPAVSSADNGKVYLAQKDTVNLKIENQMNQLTRNQLLFEQNTKQAIERLSEQNIALNIKIQALDKQIALLVSQFKSPQRQISTKIDDHFSADILSQRLVTFHEPLRVLLLIILLILTFYALYRLLIHPLKKEKNTLSNSIPAQEQGPEDMSIDDEGEYDFMQSEEGITAQLDLARAYLAMNDYESARQALQTVSNRGNTQQKAEALTLIKQLPDKSMRSSESTDC